MIDPIVAHIRDPEERYDRASAIVHELTRRAALADKEPDEKVCTKCGEVKPLDAYHANASRPDGRHVWCRACR